MANAVLPVRPEARIATVGRAQRLPFRHWYLLTAVGLAVAALALRLHRIDHESLWLDEGYTLLFSHLPLPRLLLVGGAHEHPPLYYLIVHLLLAARDSYLVPRYVSAVSGSLAVVVLYLLGARLFGRPAGLVAAALVTISPFQLWYGQDGRGYELAGLFVLLSYLTLLQAWSGGRLFRWCVYAACTAAALYSEYTTAFVLLPQVMLLLSGHGRDRRHPLLLAWLGIGLVYLPWAGILAFDVAGVASDYWIPGPTVGAVSTTVLEFLGFTTPCPSPPCTGHEVNLLLLAGHEAAVAALLAAAVLSVTIYAFVRRDVPLGLVSAWLVLPFALVLLIAVRRSLYLDRVFLDATYALYLLLGAGVAAVRRHVLLGAVALAAVLLMGIASLMNVGPIYAGGVNPDWKTPARDFRAAYRPGQAVVFLPGVLRSLLAAYLPPGWHATYERPLWSRVYLDVPGWQRRFPEPPQPDKAMRLRIEAHLRNAQLSEVVADHAQIWLITYDYSGMNDARRWFSDHGFQNLISEVYSGDTRIELWSRSGPGPTGVPVVPDRGFGPGSGWTIQGGRARGDVLQAQGPTTAVRSFPVQAGRAYSVSMAFRGVPGSSKPAVPLRLFDAHGHVLATFPRTRWYDWPVSGVWLSQPYGFVSPPGAVRATLTLQMRAGTGYWRDVAVYRES